MAIKPVQIGLFNPAQSLPSQVVEVNKDNCGETLEKLLAEDLDFSGQNGSYTTHNFHSFPAKFPPQLPGAFIRSLTDPGDIVLDPMMGSGTTVVEALLQGRKGIGLEIDPGGLHLVPAKTMKIDRYGGIGRHKIQK